ncbi:hypothetical protein OPV22_025518 [Ensete ventricosum]|uniref:Uncharacterized protein n=1 Tax=Ensete ventricosum TaxID=4639 RepID=A0AAV8QA31_ENSVE|nr:hypothetical protein OPV22_025518 [Ensete ventricosum]
MFLLPKISGNRIKTPFRNVADEEIISRGNHTLKSRPPTEPTACRLQTPASPPFPPIRNPKTPLPCLSTSDLSPKEVPVPTPCRLDSSLSLLVSASTDRSRSAPN